LWPNKFLFFENFGSGWLLLDHRRSGILPFEQVRDDAAAGSCWA
jgi:hypothetical protein